MDNVILSMVIYYCLLASSIANQQLSGSMTIQYLPSGGEFSVPNTCISYYRDEIPDSRITLTNELLEDLCNLQIPGDNLGVNIDRTEAFGSILTSGPGQNNIVGV